MTPQVKKKRSNPRVYYVAYCPPDPETQVPVFEVGDFFQRIHVEQSLADGVWVNRMVFRVDQKFYIVLPKEDGTQYLRHLDVNPPKTAQPVTEFKTEYEGPDVFRDHNGRKIILMDSLAWDNYFRIRRSPARGRSQALHGDAVRRDFTNYRAVQEAVLNSGFEGRLAGTGKE